MWGETTGPGLRLTVVLALLCVVFAGVVYLAGLDTQVVQDGVQREIDLQTSRHAAMVADWAANVTRESARQMAAPFLWNIETLEGVVEGTPTFRQLQRRMWMFVYGRDAQPLVTSSPVGPLESVMVIGLDYRIVAASDALVVERRFTSAQDRLTLDAALTKPQIRNFTRPDGRAASELNVAVPNAEGKPIGIVRLRYVGATLAKEPQLPPITVAAHPRYWGPVLAGVLALLGVGFGALATFQVFGLARRLEAIAKGAPLPPQRGTMIGATALSMVEERLEVLSDALRRDDLLVRTLSAALHEGMILLDADGTPVVANAQACRMLGLGAGPAALTMSFFSLSSDNAEMARIVETGLREKKAVRDRKLALARPDGTSADVRLTSYLLRANGETTGIVLLLRDSASIETLERNLREASRLQTIVRLSGSVAHEVKNPLGAMGIHLEHLRRGLQRAERPDPVAEDRVQIIRDEIGRLREVLEDWLRLTSPEERVPAETPVGEVVSAVERLLRVEARHQKVDLAVVVEREPGVTTLPAPRLRQVLLNLSLNALQAMPDGGQLTVRAGERDGAAWLEVEDTGAGIPADVRDRVFDVHFTTRADGSGLGLAICRQLVEEAGGTIAFDSEVGRGTVFRLSIPLAVRNRERRAAADSA